MNANEVLQKEELEALCAIYDKGWQKELNIDNSYFIQITPDVQLSVTLNPGYPTSNPPVYQLLAPTLTGEQKHEIHDAFEEIYRNNLGGPVLFEWIEKLKDIAVQNATKKVIDEIEESNELGVNNSNPSEDLFNIIHGSIIQDRKSTFQAHACTVENHKQVKDVLEVLLRNKKIEQATHNILAYRICLQNTSILQDYDDDGEAHAGGRLLHLLQILDLTNVMVVVTRWYGGIHLGPDRFRHINNAARLVLQQAGFIKAKAV